MIIVIRQPAQVAAYGLSSQNEMFSLHDQLGELPPPYPSHNGTRDLFIQRNGTISHDIHINNYPCISMILSSTKAGPSFVFLCHFHPAFSGAACRPAAQTALLSGCVVAPPTNADWPTDCDLSQQTFKHESGSKNNAEPPNPVPA